MAHPSADDDALSTSPVGLASAPKPSGQHLYATALGRILKHLSDHGATTINQLTEITAVSRPTVQRALAELEELGLAAETEHRPGGLGRPARTWSPQAGPQAVMALDIRPDLTRVRVCSLTGPVLIDHSLDHALLRVDSSAAGTPGTGAPGADPTAPDTAAPDTAAMDIDVPPGGSALAVRILRRVRELLDDIALAPSAVLETVIGVSGIVDGNGAVVLSVHVPELTGVALGDLARSVVGLTSVDVENDMNLRAVGEMSTGSAQELSSFVYLTNHDFHRPAVVLGGELWHGTHHIAGEGDVLSRTGVLAADLTHDGRSVPYFATAALLEDGALGREWIGVLNTQLAAVMAVLCYALDPEAVIVHGGPLTTGTEALADLDERFGRFSRTRERPRLIAGTRGTELTMSGALALALRDALIRVLGVPDPPLPDLTSARPDTRPDSRSDTRPDSSTTNRSPKE